MKKYCNFIWPNGKKCVILHLEYYYRIIKTQTENMVEISDKPKKPDNFLVWSILSTILCCLPLGIVAIVYSSKVDTLYSAGQYAEAEDAAKKAKTYTLIGAGVGLLVALIYILLIAVGVASGLSGLDY
jgi:ABC-type Fe3+ transport system permease subunit